MSEIFVGTTTPIEVTVEVPTIEVIVSGNLPGPPGPPGEGGGGTEITELNDLSDVDTMDVGPVLDDALVYDGSIWRPKAVAGEDEVHVGPTPPSVPFDGQVWIDTTGEGAPPPVTGGVTDHGALSGLSDDDHTQYYNATRGAAAFAALVHTHGHSTLTGLDTDSATTALHHTLGTGSLQAAPGDHTHPATSGAVILSGTVPPTGVIGSEGNYYLDSFKNILYGPKSGTAWPVAVHGVPSGGNNGQVLSKTSVASYALAWATPAAGGGGGLQARQLSSFTSSSLATGASQQSTITLAPSYRLMIAFVDKPCRVRIYDLASRQAADVGRAIGTDPIDNHGLMFEYVFTQSVLSATLSPTVDGFDFKPTPDGVVPITITNLSGTTGTVGVSLWWIRTE